MNLSHSSLFFLLGLNFPDCTLLTSPLKSSTVLFDKYHANTIFGFSPWELDGIAGNKVGGFVFVRHAFRHVYKFVIHCLSLHLFACQSFKFRCNVGIHYAFQARALSPDYIINL